LSLDFQSQIAKFHELKVCLELYKHENIFISATCLQEIWLSEDSDTSLLQLEDNNFISKGKSCSTHGDVAIYLHKTAIHEQSEFWDGHFFEITEKFSTVCNIYRPPRPNWTDVRNLLIQWMNYTLNCNNLKMS